MRRRFGRTGRRGALVATGLNMTGMGRNADERNGGNLGENMRKWKEEIGEKIWRKIRRGNCVFLKIQICNFNFLNIK